MINVKCEYRIKDDIRFFMEAEAINMLELSEMTKVSRTTLEEIEKHNRTTNKVCEKFYSYIYNDNYRLNSVKEELVKEKYKNVLFHGSKRGLEKISVAGSRDNCDFGKGFYLGENYSQAIAFVSENVDSSVYSFAYSLEGLKVKEFGCSLEWMLAICYYRGTLGEYEKSKTVKKIVEEIDSTDVVVAPIANNRMFYIMAQFAEGEINADVALHSLSTSGLGLQYIFKTEKALENLVPIEKYYLSNPEREDCRRRLNERSFEIDTKLKLAKREYKTGLYIEEILK